MYSCSFFFCKTARHYSNRTLLKTCVVGLFRTIYRHRFKHFCRKSKVIGFFVFYFLDLLKVRKKTKQKGQNITDLFFHVVTEYDAK